MLPSEAYQLSFFLTIIIDRFTEGTMLQKTLSAVLNINLPQTQEKPTALKINHNIKYREKGCSSSHSSHSSILKSSKAIPKCKNGDGKNKDDSLDTCESDLTALQCADALKLPYEDAYSTGYSSLPRQNKLKVELCKNYLARGYCPYESRCRFAHGVQQLRSKDTLQSSELYRTRKCKIFFQKGECRFGERCNFRHDYRKAVEISEETEK